MADAESKQVEQQAAVAAAKVEIAEAQSSSTTSTAAAAAAIDPRTLSIHAPLSLPKKTNINVCPLSSCTPRLQRHTRRRRFRQTHLGDHASDTPTEAARRPRFHILFLFLLLLLGIHSSRCRRSRARVRLEGGIIVLSSRNYLSIYPTSGTAVVGNVNQRWNLTHILHRCTLLCGFDISSGYVCYYFFW